MSNDFTSYGEKTFEFIDQPSTTHKVVSRYELIWFLQKDMVTQDKETGALFIGSTKLWLLEKLPTEGGDNERKEN